MNEPGKNLHMRFVPPMTQEMRDSLMALRDEAYKEGKRAGRIEAEDGRMSSEIFMLGFGALAGAGIFGLIVRVFS